MNCGETVDDVPSRQFFLGSVTPWYIARFHHRGNDNAGLSNPYIELSERQCLIGYEPIDIIEYDDRLEPPALRGVDKTPVSGLPSGRSSGSAGPGMQAAPRPAGQWLVLRVAGPAQAGPPDSVRITSRSSVRGA